MPSGQTEHFRSAVAVDAAEKNVPASQVELSRVQEVATTVPNFDAEATEANVPVVQAVQLRSAVAEAAAEKKVPGGHDSLCLDGQAVARLAVMVDSMVFCEKVPAAQGVQTRSRVGVDAAE